LPSGHDAAPNAPPPADRTLADPKARVAAMDRLGIDIQVVISTFFLGADLRRVEAHRALARSCNRWLAECCRQTNGRLRWSLVPPLLDMGATIEEMRYGAANGAVSVLVRGIEGGRLLTDAYFSPMYAEAERLGLAIGVHIGLVDRQVHHQRSGIIFSVLPVIGAFVSLFVSDLPTRFPRLRFAFLEAGSEWLPFAFREISRGADTGRRQNIVVTDRPLSGTSFYVACTMDEDLSHVLRFAGDGNLVLGTDYGHQDLGTDETAHRVVSNRQDVPLYERHRIVDDNARALYGF
jgi:predicted TIM-barrel fold metal-dependent hydrolase